MKKKYLAYFYIGENTITRSICTKEEYGKYAIELIPEYKECKPIWMYKDLFDWLLHTGEIEEYTEK